jgi:hypothetical protein
MTLVDVLVFVVAAILTLHVCLYATRVRVRCSAVDDERQTIDARAPYVCVCVFARLRSVEEGKKRNE